MNRANKKKERRNLQMKHISNQVLSPPSCVTLGQVFTLSVPPTTLNYNHSTCILEFGSAVLSKALWDNLGGHNWSGGLVVLPSNAGDTGSNPDWRLKIPRAEAAKPTHHDYRSLHASTRNEDPVQPKKFFKGAGWLKKSTIKYLPW